MSQLILASASVSRRRILENAGVAHVVRPVDVDEERIKERLIGNGASAEAVAEALAEVKACRSSSDHRPALVVGADQVLECAGELWSKPLDGDGMRKQLERLSGRTHRLVSAVAAARGGEVLWRHTDSARLTVRPLGRGFIDRYLTAAGAPVRDSVGCYRLEGIGVQLFSRIEGDFFTILGLPLLPLLQFLREQGFLPD